MFGGHVVRSFGRASVGAIATLLVLPTLAFAQSPWERAASNLATTFTGPLARSLALVAIVIGGLMFMYGESGAKRQISGIVFGGGLALFAAQFLTWLFCRVQQHVWRWHHAGPPDLPAPLQGPSSSADRLRRRSPPVLSRAAPRRGHVQPLLLISCRLVDVWRPIRLCPLGHEARPGD